MSKVLREINHNTRSILVYSLSSIVVIVLLDISLLITGNTGFGNNARYIFVGVTNFMLLLFAGYHLRHLFVKKSPIIITSSGIELTKNSASTFISWREIERVKVIREGGIFRTTYSLHFFYGDKDLKWLLENLELRANEILDILEEHIPDEKWE